MPSERIQRRIDTFLDEADAAATRREWDEVAEKSRAVLAINDENPDAQAFLKMAEANLGAAPATSEAPPAPRTPTIEHPSSFVAGRYVVRRFLGDRVEKVRRDKPA